MKTRYPSVMLYPEPNRAKLLQRWLAHLDYLVTPEDHVINVWEARIPDTPPECFGYVAAMSSGLAWSIRQTRDARARCYLPHGSIKEARRSIKRWGRRAWYLYAGGKPGPEPHDPDVLTPADPRWPWE